MTSASHMRTFFSIIGGTAPQVIGTPFAAPVYTGLLLRIRVGDHMGDALLRNETPTEYFRELVQSAMHNQHLAAQELTSFYIVNLLSGFVHHQHAADEPLGIRFARALQDAGLAQRDGLRRVGDLSLFISGFFADSLNRSLVDVDYYIQIGETAYASLARQGDAALGRGICAVCCGTKRLVEIDCPPECAHLSSAREHPAAVVRRQHARDVAVLMPTIRHLTERQHQLFFLFHVVIAGHKPEGFARLVDADLAEAAQAFAATLETSQRGVIYEHVPQSIPAQRLASELQAALEGARKDGAVVYDGEAAIALRAIEQGARELGKVTEEGDTAYQDLVARLLQVNRAAKQGGSAPAEGRPASSLILP